MKIVGDPSQNGRPRDGGRKIDSQSNQIRNDGTDSEGKSKK